MIERIYILESVDPVIFYGVNNVNMQLIKTLFPKLRIVARGNVMKVIGDEDESELFLRKIREIEKYCEEFNSLSEEVILDIIKNRSFRKLCLHSKVVITTSAALLLIGTILLKVTEDITWLGAFFHSVSARTAGFSTYTIGEFSIKGCIM